MRKRIFGAFGLAMLMLPTAAKAGGAMALFDPYNMVGLVSLKLTIHTLTPEQLEKLTPIYFNLNHEVGVMAGVWNFKPTPEQLDEVLNKYEVLVLEVLTHDQAVLWESTKLEHLAVGHFADLQLTDEQKTKVSALAKAAGKAIADKPTLEGLQAAYADFWKQALAILSEAQAKVNKEKGPAYYMVPGPPRTPNNAAAG